MTPSNDFFCVSQRWKIGAFLMLVEDLNESCWWMIKGSCNLNKVRSAITSLFCPWLNAAPPHYEKQAELRWSAGTANTPSTQAPSSSSSRRSTCVFEKISKLVWRGQMPSPRWPKMSWGFIAKLLLTNNSSSFIVPLYSFIATKIWVLEWRSRALHTRSLHPWADHVDAWQSLLPAK